MLDRLKSDLVDYYDAHAADRSTAHVRPDRTDARRRFVAELDRSDVRGLVDVGAGAGQDAAAFVAVGLDVVAVDLSFEHCCWSRVRGARSVRADVYRLPFRSGSIEAVWSASTLMHLPADDVPDVLTEIRRTLRPEAPAMLGVWTGADQEFEQVVGTHRRFYSMRSASFWLGLYRDRGFGVLESWVDTTSGDDDSYLWCLLR